MEVEIGELGVTLIGGGLGLAAGSLIPGLGLAMGWSIGTAVAQMFQAPPPSQNKLQNIQISGSQEGAYLPWVFGQQRVGGNVIWCSSWRESAVSHGLNDLGKGGLGSGGPYTYHYSLDVAFELCPGSIRHCERLYANGNVMAEWDGVHSKWIPATGVSFDSISVYNGTTLQSQDPTMYAALGAACPGYRKRCIVVIKNLDCNTWSNSFPNIEFDIWAGVPYKGTNLVTASLDTTLYWDKMISLDLMLTALFRLAKLDDSKFDVTAVNNIWFYGYSFPGDQTIQSMLSSIAAIFCIDIVEGNGKILVTPHPTTSSFTIDASLIGCATDGEPPMVPILFTETDDLKLPSRASISYRNVDNNFMAGNALIRFQTAISDQTLDINEGIALYESMIPTLLRTLLYKARVEGNVAKFTLPIQFLPVLAGDALTIPYTMDGVSQDLFVRVKKISSGSPGHLEIDGVVSDPTLYNEIYAIWADNTYIPGTGSLLESALDTEWALWDTTAAQDDDANARTVYFASAGTGKGWPGSYLLGGDSVTVDSFQYVGGKRLGLKSPSNLGLCSTTLGNGRVGVWDNINTLTVVMAYNAGGLSSCTEADVLKGQNFALVGNEYISFTTATLIADNTYTISGLVRGRRGTEWAVATHVSGEPFCLMNTSVINPAMNPSMIGTTMDMRNYLQGQPRDGLTTPVSYTWIGRARLPYAPCHLAGVRDGSNNLTVTWIRRVRIDGELRDYGDAPLDELTEAYRINIIISGVTVRTIVVGSPTGTYTAAQQIADGITPGDPVTLTVQQFSTVAGYGFPAGATL